MTPMSWNEERIATLTKMWEAGATASQIADELGGVSRNAVIGKAHRLGLKARPSPVKANDKKVGLDEGEVEDVERPLAAAARPRPRPPEAPLAETPVEEEDEEVEAEPVNSQPLPHTGESKPRIVSVGPGGFLRQGPGDQQAPIPPAPPRRLVPAKPSAEVVGKTSLLDLNERVCRWPMGHPGEPDFHFCGDKVNPGFPYCVQHCGRAYQAQLPRGSRRPPPPLPFGGPRVR